MTDFLARLHSEAASPVSVAHQYRLDYHSAGPDAVFLFFEGLDDKKYYFPLFGRYKSSEVMYSYLCDGKAGVTATWEILTNWKIMDAHRSLFFIDGDHDRYINICPFLKANVFVTAGYSFENYLVASDAVRVILSQYTPLNMGDERMKVIVSEFGAAHESFAARLRPLMAWSIYQRLRGQRPNLGNVKLGRVVEIRGREVARRAEGYCHFQRSCGIEERISYRGVAKVLVRLRQDSSKRWLRGKYELWFLKVFLIRIFAMFSDRERRGSELEEYERQRRWKVGTWLNCCPDVYRIRRNLSTS